MQVKRNKRFLTTEDVAMACGLSKGYYSQLERGERGKKLPVSVLIDIAKVLEIDIGTMIKYELQYIKRAYD
jgi:transcriptional regulator with XRE-family HTH domain